MTQATDALRVEFARGLAAFLDDDGEAARLRGYALGRRALEQRVGLIDLLSMLQQAVAEAAGRDDEGGAGAVLAAEGYLLECVSPYAMAFQGASEANDALRRQNELLEQTARRIAHEVHDSSSQLLAAVHSELRQAAELSPPALRPRLERARRLLDGVEEDLRRFSRELRPTILDDLGLVPALRSLAAKVSERTGLSIAVRGATMQRLPPPVEVALYRIAQEALTNVGRHARAASAEISLNRSDVAVCCTICDDGVGFAAARSQDGLGLVGIRERAASLGGSLRCGNREDGVPGACVEVTIPLETAYDAARTGG